MITFLLVVHAIIAAMLVGVILMQKSEGGGLGMGGGPAGLMTARGAADFLTRATSILATLFVIMAFVIAALASRNGGATKIDANAATTGPIGPITAPGQTGNSPLPGIPMAGQPVAPAPDAATQQALQPAAAGLPTANQQAPALTAKEQAAQLRAQADAMRKAAPAPEIKKIDTSRADKALGGIGNISIANKPATVAPAATPAPKPAVPTLNIPAPATAPASNGATPQ
ncbi:preprotein translocase subunit SecG [Sphingomonas sp. CGMCC 1.13654]|uniref:Protein-export membrane protein SecG n=1 Tax=Sphingomonas chungangi TaxID=2683589 RepID=A0A838LCM1_9SPHN|nr:preprotein translocase subunit SecG [Sphingomonas chungangi]MVW55774.1 preprotein translocase subunit SecG [Sphingomonas chungangi]